MATKNAKARTRVTIKGRLADLDRDGKATLSDARATLGMAGRKLSSATAVATDRMRKGAGAVAAGARRSAAAGKKVLAKGSDATVSAGRTVAKAAANAGGAVKESVATVSTALLDMNSDGRVDQADLKIATEKVVDATKRAAKDLGSSETAKGAAKAAAAGALIGAPLPVVGPAATAAVAATGYLAIKGVKEVAEAIGTARSGGIPKSSSSRKRKTNSAPRVEVPPQG